MAEKPVDEGSRYAIEGELGRGGMGQVFSGTDLRLGRPVAIKRIPEGLASDTERVARLQREARALGKLNHPNIATIYSFEVTRSGSRLLILERVEGETLATRIRRGPLPIQDALFIAEQIAAALEAAHQRGVVHRDLKPANVMVTPQGQVKVLDFGLAKISTDPSETSDGGEELDRTHPGLTIGTPGYMSPEQVRGLEADRRSDLFSFGCVLYECLTGARAFGGTPEQAMGRVLLRNPSWSVLPPETPPPIRDLLERCLEKDPQKRLSEASEARSAIRHALGSPASTTSGGTAHPLSGTRRFPVPLTSFVGREREIEEVLEILDHSRILTLTGPGGSGKTRLASKIAERKLALHSGEIWWVDLAGIQEPERVPAAVAAALGIREAAHEGILDTIEGHLSSRESLVVLDCCEHVLASCQGLATVLLSRASRLTVLATSREPLRVQGERVYPVPALPTASPRPKRARGGPAAPMSDAARLFFDRARAMRPDLVTTGKELEAVEEICRRLEGLPLAIELAAARVRVLTPVEILGKLPDQLRLLAGGPPGAEPRHQALAATIRWSYDLLTREEKAFLRALSVFTGGWTLEAAREIAGGADEFEVLELLSRLVDKSLVVAEPAVGDQLRFRFLESVRQYALEELRRHGEEAATRARHLDHFIRVAERAAPELYGPEQGAWLERLEADHENILTALWWCRCSDGAHEGCALRIASRLWRFWFGQGHLELGRTVLRTVLALPGAASRTADRAEALAGAGALAFHQNDYEEGFASYEESLAIARERDDAAGIGFALGGLGNLHLSRGEYDAARERYEAARAEFARAGHRRGEGLMVSNLGRLLELEGDVERAHELSGQGIAIFRELGDVGSLALRLSSYAEEALRMGSVTEAREHLLECLHVIQELGEPHPGTYALERTAALLEVLGEPRAAVQLCGAGDALRQRIGSPRSPKEKSELDALLLRLQRAAGGTAFGEAWGEGRALSFEGAVAEALRLLESVENARA